MKSFHLFLLFLMLFLSNHLYAQDISGTIVDNQNEPIGFASVTVLAADSAFLSGTTCDANGHYTLPKNDRAKYLRISSVGYQTATIDIANATSPIVLSADAKVLDAVEVVSMRKLVTAQADRLNYDMQADPDSKTNTLLDMLKKVPLVSVDGENQVRVNGNTSFKYYKNGHYDPSLSGNPKEVLRSIPANLVKRIEVITEPGAKYDAEGVTAILNIVMLDEHRLVGVSGSISSNFTSQLSFNPSVYVSASTGKFTLSAHYTYQHTSKKEAQQSATEDVYYVNSGNRMFSQNALHQPYNVHIFNLNGSYEIDSLNLITASFGGHTYKLNYDNVVSCDFYDATGSKYMSYNYNSVCPVYNGNVLNGRLDYEHRTRKPDEVLTLSYMYSTTGTHKEYANTFYNLVNTNFDYNAYDVHSKERFTEHTVQLDYVRPLWQYHKLEVGGKYILRLNRSDNGQTYYSDETRYNHMRFHHDTTVGAAYASWMYNRNRFSLIAGLRYELSRLEAKYPDGDGTNFHRNLNDLVPSVTLNYRFNDTHSLRFSYAESINRPGISYLNPAVEQSPTVIQQGYSTLHSSRNHSLSLTYQVIGDKFTFYITPRYIFDNDRIDKVQYVENDIIHRTYSNDVRFRQAALSAYVQASLSKTTRLVLNLSSRYTSFHNPVSEIKQHTWHGTYYGQLSQELPWSMRFTLSAFGTFGHSINGLYNYTSMKWKNFTSTLQRSFLKEKRLSVALIWESMFAPRMKLNSYMTRGDYLEVGTYSFPRQRVALQVSYRFGKKSVRVKSTEKTIENNDVVGGIKSM